jgi:hypothetical protein
MLGASWHGIVATPLIDVVKQTEERDVAFGVHGRRAVAASLSCGCRSPPG